jgi:hypothetical protein
MDQSRFGWLPHAASLDTHQGRMAEHQQSLVLANDAQELLFVDRLGDEVVDLHRVATLASLCIIGRRQYDDGGSRTSVWKGSHFGHNFKPIAVGQTQIQQQQVGCGARPKTPSRLRN